MDAINNTSFLSFFTFLIELFLLEFVMSGLMMNTPLKISLNSGKVLYGKLLLTP